MARKQMKTRKGRKQRTHKVRRQRGAGWGFTGASSIPGTPGTVSNPQVFTGIGDCRAVKPGYDIPYSQYGASFKGLPGMSGGKRSRKAMKGGRYGFAPDMIPGVTPQGGAWWAATYGPVQRIACEGSTPNPLNPGPHTTSTQPTPVASAVPSMSMLKGLMSGGGQQMAPATVGVGNVDSMYYYAPTGGYANTASTWKDSVGAPVQIQVPYAARAMNQACLTTGGSPPLTGALQQAGGKRSRKNRKQKGGLWPFNLLFGKKNTNTSLNAGVGMAYETLNAAQGAAPTATSSGNGSTTTTTTSSPGNGSNGRANVTIGNTTRPLATVGPAPVGPAPASTNGLIMGGRRRKHRKGKKSRKGNKRSRGSRKH